MGLWKAAPEEVRLEATAEDSQRWCRRDVVQQSSVVRQSSYSYRCGAHLPFKAVSQQTEVPLWRTASVMPDQRLPFQLTPVQTNAPS